MENLFEKVLVGLITQNLDITGEPIATQETIDNCVEKARVVADTLATISESTFINDYEPKAPVA